MGVQDERERDPNFVSDAYAECYPAFHDFGNTVVDSDDEDLTHMDTKALTLTPSPNRACSYNRWWWWWCVGQSVWSPCIPACLHTPVMSLLRLCSRDLVFTSCSNKSTYSLHMVDWRYKASCDKSLCSLVAIVGALQEETRCQRECFMVTLIWRDARWLLVLVQGKMAGKESYTTEEQWQAAKAKQETLPKAAFQFGQKMSDGRKAHNKLGKGKDNKLKNELSSIKVTPTTAVSPGYNPSCTGKRSDI